MISELMKLPPLAVISSSSTGLALPSFAGGPHANRTASNSELAGEARPETRQQMAVSMRDAVQAAWEGVDPHPALEAAGQAGADGIRAYIDSHIPPPNSPVTVHGGWIYNRKARKGVYVPGKGFDKPLFDTGALYDAFDYEVEE